MSETQSEISPTPRTSEPTEANPALTFSILRRGATEPGGPYDEKQILQMLREEKITRRDYVYFEGMTEWRPLEDVFEIHEKITHIVDDGQDKYKLGEIFREVSNVLLEGEEIYYIAIQDRAGLLHKAKQSVVVTNRHLFHLLEKRAGYEIEAHRWGDVSNTLMRDDRRELGTFSFLLGMQRRVDIPNIPLVQVKRLFQLSQEMKS